MKSFLCSGINGFLLMCIHSLWYSFLSVHITSFQSQISINNNYDNNYPFIVLNEESKWSSRPSSCAHLGGFHHTGNWSCQDYQYNRKAFAIRKQKIYLLNILKASAHMDRRTMSTTIILLRRMNTQPYADFDTMITIW